MLESTESPVALTRASIPELLRVVSNEVEVGNATWNVVHSLELLLDAGAVHEAHRLARSVVGMLENDLRDRLFQGYIALCEILEAGRFRENLERLEELLVEIGNGRFSNVDQGWITILVARALHYGVLARAIPESEILRARALLSSEFSKGPDHTSPQMVVQVGMELAKSYFLAPSPELSAARELTERLLNLTEKGGVSAETIFDLRRMLYQASPPGSIPATRLRSATRSIGQTARGLAELAIAKGAAHGSAQGARALEKALILFESNGYRSGAYEALVSLAIQASGEQHNARALRFFTLAYEMATSGGFLHGRGVALLGMFQGALTGGDVKGAAHYADLLLSLCKGELFFSAFGLNVVGCLQSLGRHKEAATLAMKSEKHFALIGAHTLTSQATYMLGATYAESSKWKSARDAWKRSLLCDELSRDFIGACDKRAAIAQAIVMMDLTKNSEVQESTRREVQRLLEKSERALLPYGESSAGQRTLGKVLHIHAQIAILTHSPVDSLKLLSRAREIFSHFGLGRECALTDALNGLALLEASKNGDGSLLEEGISALQRAREYFSQQDELTTLWKVNYYLSAAALMRAQRSADPHKREAWLQMSAGFVGEAFEDSAKVARSPGMPRSSSGEGDFSPGLTPEVLETISQALGVASGPTRQPRQSKDKKVARVRKYGKYLH